MASRALVSACACAAICLAALPAEADVQSNRWFYDMSNEGNDVHFMIQLIEEDPPSFDTTFKLTRDQEVLFEHRQFDQEEADEVFGPGCIEDWSEADFFNADCDGDGTDDCAGICGTAYRYAYVDECVADGAASYDLYDEATGDRVGAYHYEFQSEDDVCLESDDPGCSAAGAPGNATEGGLAALMLLAGLGFAVVARRNGSR